jgi:hypothetical protein
MNEARTTREIDAASSLRAQRHAAALIAQYVHDQSERHAGTRQGSPAYTGHPREAMEALGAQTR